jgi:hypothetical protein
MKGRKNTYVYIFSAYYEGVTTYEEIKKIIKQTFFSLQQIRHPKNPIAKRWCTPKLVPRCINGNSLK